MKKTSSEINSVMGIDVSKDKLDIFYYQNDKERYITIENNDKSIRSFLRSLSKNKLNFSMLVMEHTGGYEKLAHKLFEKAGCPVHVAHPLRVHYFSKQKGYFAKTDKIDARILSEYGAQNDLNPSLTQADVNVELKELFTRRGQLVDQLTIEKYRLKPHLTAVTKKSIQRTIKQLGNEIKLIEGEINGRIEQVAEKAEIQRSLKTFKGVGNTVANALICGLPELGTLSRAEIACLVGVAPRNKDSGIAKGRRMICGGRFYVRKVLYMAALVAIRYNTKMKVFYRRLKDKNKHSKVALTAVMKKIIVTLNSMLKHQKDWDEHFLANR